MVQVGGGVFVIVVGGSSFAKSIPQATILVIVTTTFATQMLYFVDFFSEGAEASPIPCVNI